MGFLPTPYSGPWHITDMNLTHHAYDFFVHNIQVHDIYGYEFNTPWI